MADHRVEVVRALAGPDLANSTLPLAGLALQMAMEALPKDLTMAMGVDRLLAQLDPTAVRRVVSHAASKMGLKLVRAGSPADPASVERALEEADKLSATLHDFMDDMERDHRAVVLRSTDPGASVLTARCETCRAPKIVAAACLRLEDEGKGWAVVVTEP